MNSYRENAEPPMDATEVAKAKIRAVEETKRAARHEAEETKREAIRERTKVRNDSNYPVKVVLTAFVCVVALITAGLCYSSRLDAEPGACHEEIFVVDGISTDHHCKGNARMEVSTTDKITRVACRCTPTPASAEAGAP